MSSQISHVQNVVYMLLYGSPGHVPMELGKTAAALLISFSMGQASVYYAES